MMHKFHEMVTGGRGVLTDGTLPRPGVTARAQASPSDVLSQAVNGPLGAPIGTPAKAGCGYDKQSGDGRKERRLGRVHKGEGCRRRLYKIEIRLSPTGWWRGISNNGHWQFAGDALSARECVYYGSHFRPARHRFLRRDNGINRWRYLSAGGGIKANQRRSGSDVTPHPVRGCAA